MNIKLLIANVVIIGLVAGFFWLRSEYSKRTETRRANGQLRLLGPTDEMSELTQAVREWADHTGVLKERPDVLPDFGSAAGNAEEADDADVDETDVDETDDVEDADKEKVS